MKTENTQNNKIKIGIIDYSAGNIHSVYKAFAKKGVSIEIVNKETELDVFDGIVLPGVGACGSAMDFLTKIGLIRRLNYYVLELKKPILGICLGFQIMTEFSEEGPSKGLGWIPVNVCHIRNVVKSPIRVPHIGWNDVKVYKDELSLLSGMIENPNFYFAHSYFVPFKEIDGNLGVTEYGTSFISLYQNKNIYGTQFHPEKSYIGGALLLQNFLNEVLNAKS
ncbi:MAG TPA: imidazole glycerol phosphate synthase subunit HisH [Candidatus Hydrogenedens sp.]|nr:imidazole glycerol phosphate synthase subunit HisH [Candidatus Hydrogenedens sp.]